VGHIDARNNYMPGEIAVKKINDENIIILKRLESLEEDAEFGQKYLARDLDHKKIVIHGCELKIR